VLPRFILHLCTLPTLTHEHVQPLGMARKHHGHGGPAALLLLAAVGAAVAAPARPVLSVEP
jgi:hypothetical protein